MKGTKCEMCGRNLHVLAHVVAGVVHCKPCYEVSFVQRLPMQRHVATKVLDVAQAGMTQENFERFQEFIASEIEIVDDYREDCKGCDACSDFFVNGITARLM